MRPFEIAYLCLEPFMPALHRRVRSELLALVRGSTRTPEVLDVGGRKSHYTIGVPARVTVSDLPRQSSLQHQLNLGITGEIAEQTLKRRSNVRRVVLDDMTCSALPSDSFDLVVAVEVLEHVEQDREFLRHVQRVLRPDGRFLMTTPNGDFLRNTNPDHKRHHRKAELSELLQAFFPSSRSNTRFSAAGTGPGASGPGPCAIQCVRSRA